MVEKGIKWNIFYIFFVSNRWKVEGWVLGVRFWIYLYFYYVLLFLSFCSFGYGFWIWISFRGIKFFFVVIKICFVDFKMICCLLWFVFFVVVCNLVYMFCIIVLNKLVIFCGRKEIKEEWRINLFKIIE